MWLDLQVPLYARSFFYCAVGLHHPWSTLSLRPTTVCYHGLLACCCCCCCCLSVACSVLLVCNRSTPHLAPGVGVAPSSRPRLGLKSLAHQAPQHHHHLHTHSGTITAAEHAGRLPLLLPPALPPPIPARPPAPTATGRPRNGVARREEIRLPSLAEVTSGSTVRPCGFCVAGIVMDPEKQNGMSLMDKRQLVYEVARWPQGAMEILQCWTRRELLELICAELGKERKYTNVPKAKMIDYLLRLVKRNGEKNGQLKDDVNANVMLSGQDNKDETQMKESEEQSRPLNTANSDPSIHREAHPGSSVVCSNVACQATLNAGDKYCKRCSCCICNKYDDNKDPSLWLVCSSDNPYSGCSCGVSCHLNCALKNKKAGIVKNGCNKFDCSFCCVSCGKINWLMRSLQKQLAIAREARRVDVLCERLSLSHKMVKGSERYKEIASLISSAVKILEKEVGGALDQVSVITGRGIVNRLTCGAEVQKLCSSALEIVDSTVDNILELESTIFRGPQPQIVEITPFSVVIVLKYQGNIGKGLIDGSKVWHRSAKVCNYSSEPTCHILRPNTRCLVSGLSPSTEYFFKVLPFSSIKGFTSWEAKCSTRSLDHGSSQCSTQNSESMCVKEDSMQNQKKDLNVQNHQRTIQHDSPKGSTNSSENNLSCERYSKRAKVARLDGASDNDESQLPPTSEVLPFASSNSSPSEAPSKPDLLIGTPDSASKNYVELQYDYCVKVIRWLEHEGHMDNDFRVKFLTWFSLKATAQDRRIVGAFVDALISDPASLVAQLVDAFMDVICIKEKPSQAQQKGACCKV